MSDGLGEAPVPDVGASSGSLADWLTQFTRAAEVVAHRSADACDKLDASASDDENTESGNANRLSQSGE